MSPMPRSQNATKHGGYSNLGILPGEDPEEFIRLLQSLIAEFAPSGATEHNVVLSLTKYFWRKSRLAIYARAEKARKQWQAVFGPNAPSEDVDTNLLLLAGQDACRTQQLLQTALDTRDAASEVKAGLARAHPIMVACLERIGTDVDQLIREGTVDYKLAELGTLVTDEMLIRDIELDARLDARIDRLLKRLFQLKAAKQMAGIGQEGKSSPAHGQPSRVLLEG